MYGNIQILRKNLHYIKIKILATILIGTLMNSGR